MLTFRNGWACEAAVEVSAALPYNGVSVGRGYVTPDRRESQKDPKRFLSCIHFIPFSAVSISKMCFRNRLNATYQISSE
jgi:hypothetical protein